jgi:hypothetical protein
MKTSALFPQVALVLAVAYACNDSTAPANSHALLTPKNPTAAVGEPPPPPVDVVIAINISSPGTAVFTGIYFTNGAITDDGTGTIPLLDGTAWLRFDNKQPDVGFLSGTTSANARFMVKDADPPTGHGTLTFREVTGDVTYKIVLVQTFTRFATCGETEETPSPCAEIQFLAEVVGGGACDLENPELDLDCHQGNLVAFEESECLSEDDEGGFEYDEDACPLPPPPPSEEIG